MKKVFNFSLGSIDIDVYDNPNLRKVMENAIGRSVYEEQKIEIDYSTPAVDIVDQTFYHELVHWITYIMGRADLCNDEVFVDYFALLLHQSIKTKRFTK